MAFEYEKWLRNDKLPHIWCPGCGHGIVMKSIIRAMEDSGLDKNKTVVASGIGCASRLPGYIDANTLHTTHGRSLAFATGVKLASPELAVIAVGGDGDMSAIGGNHFIHACRRNIDITCVCFNNFIYGMTGGQFSPTTWEGAWASTTPWGNPDPQFDLCALAAGSGATYVARGSAYNAVTLTKYIKEGIANKGFSFIEAVCHCHTTFGRKNKIPTGVGFLKWAKENCVTQRKAEKLAPEELRGKYVMGVVKNEPKPEYCDRYQAVIDKAQAKSRGE